MENARENFDKKNTQRGQQNINMLNLMTSMHPYYVPISFSYRIKFLCFVAFFFFFTFRDKNQNNGTLHSLI